MNEDFLTFEQYPEVMERVNSFFHSDKYLPEMIFKRPFHFYLMCQFDGSAMWDILEALHKIHSPLVNDTILLSILDPHPIDYFYKHYGKINAFTFNGGITKGEYVAMRGRSPGNEVDAIAYHTETETYVPSSGSWALWGEHGREMNVLGLDEPSDLSGFIF